MYEVDRSIFGYAVGIRFNSKRIIALVEGAIINEGNIGAIVELLNQA
jgi:hypothetical protein